MTKPEEKVSEALVEAGEVGKLLAVEATEFIKKNPWAAVLSAAVIGYLLGTMRARSK